MSLEILHPLLFLVNSFSAAEVLVCWFPMIPQTFFCFLWHFTIFFFMFHFFCVSIWGILYIFYPFHGNEIFFHYPNPHTSLKNEIIFKHILLKFLIFLFLCFYFVSLLLLLLFLVFICNFLFLFVICFFFFFSFQFRVCILCSSDAPHVICCMLASLPSFDIVKKKEFESIIFIIFPSGINMRIYLLLALQAPVSLL